MAAGRQSRGSGRGLDPRLVRSRRSLRGRRWRSGATKVGSSSIFGSMINVEVVEAARRAVMPEPGRVGRDAGATKQAGDALNIAGRHIGFYAVGTETGNGASDKN